MNNTAKFVNATLKWKRGKATCGDKDEHLADYGVSNLTDFESGYKSLLADHQDSSTYVEVQPMDSQVCSIKQSPYRILKAAEAGNLDSFIKLYRQNNARLKFTDKFGKRGEYLKDVVHYR